MYRFRASTVGDKVIGVAGLGQWIHVSIPMVVDVAVAMAATSYDVVEFALNGFLVLWISILACICVGI
ncbi:hypothetical protein Q3G72_012622 [Acer saccharum]|nr:hypothetical protein Q3G72_012622 [Acer saccharum]